MNKTFTYSKDFAQSFPPPRLILARKAIESRPEYKAKKTFKLNPFASKTDTEFVSHARDALAESMKILNPDADLDGLIVHVYKYQFTPARRAMGSVIITGIKFADIEAFVAMLC